MRALRSLFALRDIKSRRVWVLLCLGLFLTLQLFLAVPWLHGLIHPAADSPNHHCAITVFTHGCVDASDTSLPAVALFATAIFCLAILTSAVFSSVKYRLSPSRAPPQFSSLF